MKHKELLSLVSLLILGLVLFPAQALGQGNSGNTNCPDGSFLYAKFNYENGSYIFEEGGGGPNGVEITNATASGGNWSSMVAISTVIVKGGTDNEMDDLDPAVLSGSFSNDGLVNNGGQTPDISNIKFCAPGLKISPVLECVEDNGDGTYTARFGYDNLNDFAVTIPVGPNNRFSPAPQDRGQTTLFQPGRVGRPDIGDFLVDFDGSVNLVWTLISPNGQSPTATASANSKRCPTDECVPTDGPAWPSGVITNNGDGTGSVVIETPQGFKSISISGNNVALSDISNIPDGDLSESGLLSGNFSDGWTTITYTGTDKPTTITVVLTALNQGSSGFFIQVEDQCDISLRVDPEVNLGAKTIPQQVALQNNYPNPFNPTTVIPFDLPEATHVELAVYDMLGRRLVTLVDGVMSAGSHTATWEATNANGQAVPSGMYLYRLETDQESDTRRMLLVK